jgi:hypothetical protein
MLVNKKINLSQLDKELNGQGLNGTLDENGETVEVFLADNNNATEAQLKDAIDNHIAIDDTKAKTEQKAALLNRLGLTEDELKTIFG